MLVSPLSIRPVPSRDIRASPDRSCSKLVIQVAAATARPASSRMAVAVRATSREPVKRSLGASLPEAKILVLSMRRPPVRDAGVPVQP
jgi:hypothetical protein